MPVFFPHAGVLLSAAQFFYFRHFLWGFSLSPLILQSIHPVFFISYSITSGLLMKKCEIFLLFSDRYRNVLCNILDKSTRSSNVVFLPLVINKYASCFLIMTIILHNPIVLSISIALKFCAAHGISRREPFPER